MDPQPGGQFERLLSDALLLPSEEREAFLNRECSGNTDLRAEVERLLRDSDAMSHPDTITEGGRVLNGRFRIIRLAGQGGMGQVYEAEDLVLHVRIALKTIRADLSDASDARKRILREVQVARSVTHPNVCRIFDLVELDSPGHRIAFLTMEYLRGETLSEHLSRVGRVGPAAALAYLRQITAGLDAAHSAGVVHCDLKPSKHYARTRQRVGAGRSDGLRAGTALATGTDSAETMMGTPAYVAPEQLTGGKRSVWRYLRVGPDSV